MPSAWRDGRGYWCCRWKGIGQGRGEWTVRRPAVEQLRPGSERADALGWAWECEQACRRLDQSQTPVDHDIAHAERIGAITPAQAAMLRGGEDPGSSPRGPVTIETCWTEHPSTTREYERRPSEYARHRRELLDFLDWSGLRFARDLSLAAVMTWVVEMRRRGISWDGRRHRLLTLRRASSMAAALHGIAEVIPGRLSLDPRGADERPTVACWPWEDVWRVLIPQTAIAAMAGHSRHNPTGRQWSATPIGLRQHLAVGLGAGMGLRSSEIARLQVSDWQGHALEVGARARKTAGSWRLLPVPPTIAGWLDEACRDLQPADPILAAESRSYGRRSFASRSCAWGQWCARWLPAITGVDLPAKALRKTFATQAATHGIGEHVLEPWLGHQPERLAASTRRHYLMQARLSELQPLADAIETWIQQAATAVGASLLVSGRENGRHAERA